jgi:hypothetical protein
MMEHQMSIPSLSSNLAGLLAAHRHTHAQTTAQAAPADPSQDHDGDDAATAAPTQGAAPSVSGRGTAVNTAA